MTNGNGNGVWKYIATAAISLLLGIAVQALREPKDIVTEKELTMQVVNMQMKIDTLSNQVAALQQTVNQVAGKVGVTVVAPSNYRAPGGK